jgi:branched-chain amino acid transport system ATP-binding protein
MSLLMAESIEVAYGGIGAVHGVTLEVRAAEITTVIGPNGAGKTSLLGALMGVLPARGRLSFAGEDIFPLPIEMRVRRGLCLVPETRALFSTMSVAENLELGFFRLRAEGRAARHRALAEVFASFPRLAERRGQAAGTLSGGERQMLAMGRALMARPRLLMLDEPSLGLAPLIVREIFAIIARLRAAGASILLVEQNARAALQVADRAYVLEGGRVSLQGDAATLARDPRVVETYLGIGGEVGGGS